MKLKVLGSSSKGNCYILENDSEALIIECGVKFDKVKQALNYNLRKVVGCLLTHEHGDHSDYTIDFMKAGINVWSSQKTHTAIECINHHRASILEAGHCRLMGGFSVKAFDVQHDAASPLGFLINHNDTGNVLFLTDSFYCKYTFRHLNNIIVETNYSKEIIEKKRSQGYLPQFLNDRIIKSHMSLETCKELLEANDLSQVNNIVLIHLSDGNSDAAHFQEEIKNLTGKTVHVADAGVVIENFGKTPF
jgi:phosphoribosyl 1,2-cyclic phosphodiesterase